MSLRSRKYGNVTLDVFNKGCFGTYESVACFRSGVITTAAGITLIFVVAKIIRYHTFHHKQIQHYAIFYITGVELILCMNSSLFGHWYPQIELATCLLKLLQFSVLCQLHWSASARARCKEAIVQHAINPGLCLFAIYCLAVALMGMADVGITWNQCRKLYWLMLSIGDFLSVQLFTLAAIYLTHKSSQRRDLLTVVVAYELSATVSLLYDLLMRFVGNEENGCSGIFAHSQIAYSSVELVYVIVKFMVPVWVLLMVFQPVDDSSQNDSQVNSLNGTPTSVRSSIRGLHQYQRMAMPNVPSIATENNEYINNGLNLMTSSLSMEEGTNGNLNHDGFYRCGAFSTMATISEEGSINYSDNIHC